MTPTLVLHPIESRQRSGRFWAVALDVVDDDGVEHREDLTDFLPRDEAETEFVRLSRQLLVETDDGGLSTAYVDVDDYPFARGW